MINVGEIKKTYNGQVVVDIDEMCIETNKTYLLMGPNGSGKSTIAKLLAGLIRDDADRIIKLIDENNRLLKVAYLPQKPYIFDLSLENNIQILKRDKDKCNIIIDKFGIGYLRGKNARKFSGGEQQKLSIARLMMGDYDMVILDEPTAAMDEGSQSNAVKILGEYAKNKTMMIITHDSTQLRNISDYVITINKGKIVNNGIIKS